MPPECHPILLFDGECNLCNGWVKFVLRHERDPEIHFAALQSDIGRRLMREHGLPENQLDTVVLIEKSKAYVRSTAVLRIMRRLRRPYRWLAAAMLIPRPIRDAAYRTVARYRIRWFGRTATSCLLLTDQTRSRILE